MVGYQSGCQFYSCIPGSRWHWGVGIWNPTKVTAFDYEQSGKLDYLLIAQFGDHYVGIVKHNSDTNTNNYAAIISQCIPFDYEHSGKADYLLVVMPNPYSPRVYILKNNNDGTFTTVYQAVNGEGLGGWDFKDEDDRVIAYDYDHSRKLDYLFVYRAGKGVCSIIKNTNGVFTPVL